MVVKRALVLVLLAIAAAGCGGGSAASSSAPMMMTRAQALLDINSPDKATFCRAFDWDLGNMGFMSYNMVKRQYVRAGYGTARQFEAKAEQMNCH